MVVAMLVIIHIFNQASSGPSFWQATTKLCAGEKRQKGAPRQLLSRECDGMVHTFVPMSHGAIRKSSRTENGKAVPYGRKIFSREEGSAA